MEWLFVIAVAGIVLLAARRRYTMKGDLSMLPERFVVFDLETTGLNPERNKIIEIGAIRVNRDSSHHDIFSTLININSRVPAKITEITGITTEMLQAEGSTLEESLDAFLSFIGDLRLVSFNAEFDVSFINAALATCSKPALGNQTSCALNMARRAWPGRKSYKLKDLAEDGNLARQTHRAVGDCQLALMVYAAAANRLRTAA